MFAIISVLCRTKSQRLNYIGIPESCARVLIPRTEFTQPMNIWLVCYISPGFNPDWYEISKCKTFSNKLCFPANIPFLDMT